MSCCDAGTRSARRVSCGSRAWSIWGVVVGWVIFGFVNSVTDDVDVRLTWVVTWLLPVLVLGAGTLVTHLRVRACDADLVEVERNR